MTAQTNTEAKSWRRHHGEPPQRPAPSWTESAAPTQAQRELAFGAAMATVAVIMASAAALLRVLGAV